MIPLHWNQQTSDKQLGSKCYLKQLSKAWAKIICTIFTSVLLSSYIKKQIHWRLPEIEQHDYWGRQPRREVQQWYRE